MAKWLFWLRWSWRDLRERWLQVGAVALIIALGTGVFAGLGSTTPWRKTSVEESYALLNLHDLHLQLARGSTLPQAELLDLLHSIPQAEALAAVEVRLIAPTFVQFDAPGEGQTFVRGKLVGMPFDDNGPPAVDGLYASAGRSLDAEDAGQPVVVLDQHFADYYELPAQGQIQVSGGQRVDVVGHGFSPEYFLIITEDGGFMAQANFAVLFTTLETAQSLSGQPGQVNDAVLRVTPGADVAAIQARIEAALAERFPQVGYSFTTPEDEVVYRMLRDTVGMNQQVYNVITIMFLAGAMFGAFTLASRLVDMQRRQIGIGMALGLRAHVLMIRPLLVGAQIALLGAVLGVLMGVVFAQVARVWMLGIIPLPAYGDLLQWNIFLQAATLGLVLPFVAAIYPAWRAVRVPPIEAITTGHLVAKGGGLNALSAPLRASNLPGRSFTAIPLRNLLRAPRRTLMTILGIGAAVTTLVGLIGVQDSVVLVIERTRQETYQNTPARQIVFLNSFYASDSDAIAALRTDEAVQTSVPVIRLPAELRHAGTAFGITLEVLDLDNNPLWRPSLSEGQYRSGVVLSEYAANQLGVGVGDEITLRHPQRSGPLAYQIVESPVRVAGLHPEPWRIHVYMDDDYAALLNLAGMANALHIDPAPGYDKQAAKNALFASPLVASVVAVDDMMDGNEYVLSEVTNFLRAVQVAVILMAFLIAFNTTNINLSERTREVATMFAFGLRIRTVTRMAMLENALAGLLGTLLGTLLGLGVAWWFTQRLLPAQMPEIFFPLTLAPVTLLLALGVGVGVVGLAPLLTMRKMMQMSLPDTLRVME